MRVLARFKLPIFLGVIIIALYFLLRLPNLNLQPIFADEGIYIRWAQVMRAEPTLRFLPLSDGKTPLFMWAIIPLLKIFDDPLLAGRFLSALCGFATLAGVFLLSLRVFNLRVALWAALLYVASPYTVFFDRMALVDSMLSAFSIWSAYLAIWLLQTPRLDLAMILGYFLGGGLLTKTPAMISILALPLTIFGFEFKKSRTRLLKLLIFWVAAVSIALLVYNSLRLGVNFQMLSLRNADYVFSPMDLLGRPLDPFVPHLRDIIDWFPILLTWPVLVVMLWGTLLIIKNKLRLGWVILIWALLPLILQMAFLKTFTARYLLFSVPPLLIMAGWGLDEIYQTLKTKPLVKTSILIILILSIPLHFDYLLLTRPADAPLPKEERRGYFEEWTAGYGFKEIAAFLIEQKKQGSVVVGTEGYFGTLPDGLQIYLDKSGIPVIGDQATISAKLRISAKDNLTFYVANKNRLGENLPGVKLIREFKKAIPRSNLKQDSIVLYQVYP